MILELTQTGSRLQQGQMCCSVSLIASLIFVIQKCYLYTHVQELKAHFLPSVFVSIRLCVGLRFEILIGMISQEWAIECLWD